jgi:hypothetical protein
LQTPSNTLEFGSQSKLIQERIRRHVDSSPALMVEALAKFTEGAEMMAHTMVSMTKRNAELPAANEAATRRKSHKRKRIKQEGTLTIDKGARLAALKEFGARNDGKKVLKRARAEAGEPSQRRCGQCNQAGHNSRTYEQAAEILSK